jgi:SAM-dependent methyltransferase
VPVDTIAADVLDVCRPQAFDLVCAHAFLGRFADAQGRVLRHWHDLLAPGGAVVTVLRLRTGAPDADDVALRDDREREQSRIRTAADRAPALAGVDRDRLGGWIADYAARKRTYPVLASMAEERRLFEAAGFADVTLTSRAPAGHLHTAPRTSRFERYGVVARKPFG